MRTKTTWTPEQAREMAKKAAYVRKIRNNPQLLFSPGPHADSKVRFIRCGNPLPSPNLMIEVKETLIAPITSWPATIIVSIFWGILFGIILVILSKII